MAGRTFAIGDIHGGFDELIKLMGLLPPLDAGDTLVFLGDYVDRGPASAGVVRYLMELPEKTEANLVFLIGNHEDAWLRVIEGSYPEFVLPVGNGCLQTMESFLGRDPSPPRTSPQFEDFDILVKGGFFPPEVLEWMAALQWWFEDDYAIYVHAGLPEDDDGQFMHPSQAMEEDREALLWTRTRRFFEEYRGKPVIVGHTMTSELRQELSSFTPDDPDDLWAGPAVLAIDTRCGKEGGFLTAVELPAMLVYESRNA